MYYIVGAGPATQQVRDGGPGFTEEDLSVAFHRGALQQRYRHERKTGSGLGLALAARLVHRLNGTIEAGHAPEGGAMFIMTFPYPGGTDCENTPSGESAHKLAPPS